MSDGVVCNLPTIRWLRPTSKHVFVLPGIRRLGEDHHNHRNIATPAEAKAAGADFIVVGRPILNAPDPVAAVRAIMEEIA